MVLIIEPDAKCAKCGHERRLHKWSLRSRYQREECTVHNCGCDGFDHVEVVKL